MEWELDRGDGTARARARREARRGLGAEYPSGSPNCVAGVHVKKLVIALPLFFFAFLCIGFLLPARYEVERSVVVAAPSEAIHAYLEDLRRWEEWFARPEQGPGTSLTFSGAEQGVDARMEWSGGSEGTGSLTITASDPAKGVWFDIQTGSGFAAKCAVRYFPVEGGCRVTWTRAGNLGLNPLLRYFGLFADSLMGDDFAGKLGRIRALVEGSAPGSLPATAHGE